MSEICCIFAAITVLYNYKIMKKLLLSIMFVGCALTAAAQNAITVKFQGAKPTINDFVTAYVQPVLGEDGEETDELARALRFAWEKHRKGIKQHEDATVTVDVKNGFACFEFRSEYEGMVDLSRTEMCYWNEADQKHKLFAVNTWCYRDGKPSLGQFDGLAFFRYDNATHKMQFVAAPGFDVEYNDVTYSLPRTGRDIVVTRWKDGVPSPKVLKFNGTKFGF